MKFLAFIFFLTQAYYVHAQKNLYSDSIMRIKGIWKANNDYLTDASWHMPKAQQPGALKIGLTMHKMIKDAYPDLKGIDAKYYTSIRGEPAIANAPFPYTISAAYFWYYYNTAYRKIIPVGETGTHVRVAVNDPSFMLNPYNYNGRPQFAEVDTQNHMIRELWMEDGRWKGFTLYKEPGKEAPSGYRRSVIITKNDVPLWLPVTQWQFLQALRKQDEKALNAVIPDHDKADSSVHAMINSIKKLQVDNATKEKMLARQQQIIRENELRRDVTVRQQRNVWIKRIRIIDEYIAKQSKETLEQQAMLGTGDFFTVGFAKPGDGYVRRLVYINPAYFNYTLPGYEPQFIVVTLSVNMNYEPCVYMKNQIEANFEPGRLQALLK